MTAYTLRLWHSYISAFIAPTMLFFAISGSLQVLRLHEAHGDYVPPAFVAAMGNVHKNQVVSSPERRPRGGGPEAGPGAPDGHPDRDAGPGGGPPGEPHAERPAKLSTQLLKGLFVLEAAGLVFTIVLGVWIGITHAKRARTFWIVLGAGAVLPVVLLLF